MLMGEAAVSLAICSLSSNIKSLSFSLIPLHAAKFHVLVRYKYGPDCCVQFMSLGALISGLPSGVLIHGFPIEEKGSLLNMVLCSFFHARSLLQRGFHGASRRPRWQEEINWGGSAWHWRRRKKHSPTESIRGQQLTQEKETNLQQWWRLLGTWVHHLKQTAIMQEIKERFYMVSQLPRTHFKSCWFLIRTCTIVNHSGYNSIHHSFFIWKIMLFTTGWMWNFCSQKFLWVPWVQPS